MSAPVSHHGGWTRYPTSKTTPSIGPQINPRSHQRRRAMASASANTRFKHSSQRHGNCTKRNSGRCIQKKKVGLSMSTVQKTLHAAMSHHIVRLPRCPEKNIATAVRTMTHNAITETSKLKRL